jgi:hypothetical protein
MECDRERDNPSRCPSLATPSPGKLLQRPRVYSGGSPRHADRRSLGSARRAVRSRAATPPTLVAPESEVGIDWWRHDGIPSGSELLLLGGDVRAGTGWPGTFTVVTFGVATHEERHASDHPGKRQSHFPDPSPRRSRRPWSAPACRGLCCSTAGAASSCAPQPVASGAGAFRALFLTHLHSDHITDLNDIVTTRWAMTLAPQPPARVRTWRARLPSCRPRRRCSSRTSATDWPTTTT